MYIKELHYEKKNFVVNIVLHIPRNAFFQSIIYTLKHKYTNTQIHTYTQTHTDTHTHAQKQTHTHTHTLMHTLIHTDMHP